MVSEERARVRDGNLQRRIECWRDCRTFDCAVDRDASRLALGIHTYGCDWSRVALLLAPACSPARTTSESIKGGTRLYSQRSRGSTGEERAVAEFDPAPANVCLRDRKVSYRSDLVVLSLLDTEFLSRQTRTRSHHDWSTANCDLSNRRHRQHRRWL